MLLTTVPTMNKDFEDDTMTRTLSTDGPSCGQ